MRSGGEPHLQNLEKDHSTDLLCQNWLLVGYGSSIIGHASEKAIMQTLALLACEAAGEMFHDEGRMVCLRYSAQGGRYLGVGTTSALGITPCFSWA